MATNRWLPPEGHWVIGLVAGFLLALSPSLGGWSNGEEPAGNATHIGTKAQQPRISIQHGRLTLTLQGADVRKVIVEMGQLAGIPVILGPIPERRVSAELTDIELDEGFRRLLRLADLNHTILYTQGPEGKMEIKKVIVFGAEQGLPPLPPTAAEPDRDESPADGRGRMLHAEMLGETALLPGDSEASTVMIHIQDAIERYRKQRSQLADEDKNEAVRRFQQGIEQAIRAQTESPSPPRAVDEIIALIPRELEGYQPFTARQAESETLHHLDAPPRGETPAR